MKMTPEMEEDWRSSCQQKLTVNTLLVFFTNLKNKLDLSFPRWLFKSLLISIKKRHRQTDSILYTNVS